MRKKTKMITIHLILLLCCVLFYSCTEDAEDFDDSFADSEIQDSENADSDGNFGGVKSSDGNNQDSEYIEVIDILGTIYKDGNFQKRPWYTYEAEPDITDGKNKGEYSIVMKNSSGAELSADYFDISFMTQSNPPEHTDFMPVNVTVQYNREAASIEILKGADSIYKADITANSPEVSFESMNTQYEGKAEISWTGADEDGGDIFYEIWYATDNDDFISLATDITTTSLAVDFNTLPGSDEASIFIYATDGVNTTEVESSSFTVGYKPPEILSKQEIVPEYKLTDEIQFDADIYDKQDGWLYEDNEVSWIYKGKEYTTGSLLWIWPYEMSSGTHTFTVKAQNSKGISAEKEFNFKIIDDESALPNDWSKEDIKNALANGFVAPLANVNSAITRGQFAKLMANMYWAMYEEGSPDPDYEEDIVKDCGQDNFDQFLMVKLGVMEAKDGKFNPNKNLTEEEAAVIMYNICRIADPNLVDDGNATQIVENLLDYGVIDEIGENLFNASDKITGRLALVRCNRLYEAVFGEE